MVVEVLEMADVRRGAGHVEVEGWRAVARHLQSMRRGHGRRPLPLTDAAAASDVHLEDVDCSRCAHALEVEEVVAVFAGSHIRTDLLPDLVQAFEIIRGDRLLEPGDVAGVGEVFGEAHRLLAAIGAVGVDEEVGVGADRLPGPGNTFEAVTGPKRDRWLVKTVGVLVAVIGASLATVRRPAPPTTLLALGSAAGLGAVDVIYSTKGAISRVYLLDAVLEALLIAGWLAALRRRRP